MQLHRADIALIVRGPLGHAKEGQGWRNSTGFQVIKGRTPEDERWEERHELIGKTVIAGCECMRFRVACGKSELAAEELPELTGRGSKIGL